MVIPPGSPLYQLVKPLSPMKAGHWSNFGPKLFFPPRSRWWGSLQVGVAKHGHSTRVTPGSTCQTRSPMKAGHWSNFGPKLKTRDHVGGGRCKWGSSNMVIPPGSPLDQLVKPLSPMKAGHWSNFGPKLKTRDHVGGGRCKWGSSNTVIPPGSPLDQLVKPRVPMKAGHWSNFGPKL